MHWFWLVLLLVEIVLFSSAFAASCNLTMYEDTSFSSVVRTIVGAFAYWVKFHIIPFRAKYRKQIIPSAKKAISDIFS